MWISLISLLPAALATWLAALSALVAAEEPPVLSEATAHFETHVRPLLMKRCLSCHSAAEGDLEGGLGLDSRLGWQEGGERGPAVVPGDPEASLLIRAVRYTDPDLQMPPDRQLAAEEIARLEEWVRLGAPDPRDGVPRTQHGPDPSDPVAGREHWAFQPLADPQPPSVNAGNWPLAELDLFVLARLEAEGLAAAGEAEPTTLLRRLSFALTGLPPSREQIAAFTADPSEAAYERLVDEMLASRQFGERWGRHWLDLARYADSNGLDENFLFREAWRYRNWVIDAVAADMPFDRFLAVQLAGDLLPFDSTAQRDRQRIGAGFLTIGPKVLLGNPAEKQKMEVADELIDTVGRAVLGQTLGCARCHDHKFDPVPTADYHALAGIFTSTDVMERRYMLGEQRVMERLVGLGDGGEEVDDAYEHYWRTLRPGLEVWKQRGGEALSLLTVGSLENADTADALAKIIAEVPEAVAEAARDPQAAVETRIQAQRAFLANVSSRLASPPPIPPRAMSPMDRDEPAHEFIRIAGDPDRKGEQVPRGFLQVLSDASPEIPASESGRIQLTAWLTDVDGGGGALTARVLANRVWHHLIGRGIVRTVDNFGRTGELPTHPQLLEHLAGELVAADWSLKSLVRQVVLSRSFRLSSRHDDAAAAIDPANTLLWRAHRRRLDPESLRDAMRAAAGTLDLAPMESTVGSLGDQATAVGGNTNRRRTDFPCRSVYLPVIRNDLPEVFQSLDFADPHKTTGLRPQTTVATQGLYMLNNEQVMDAAAATASRVLEACDGAATPAGQEAALGMLFELVVGKLPDAAEREAMRRFLQQAEESKTAAGAEHAQQDAWGMAAHALMASSRFQMVE
ncbi:MAG: PSD1 domain-containing protein [Pirellulales bacterium]|nr:PSD1 domain-containing protein [Pirellulales bacterium]